MIGHDQAVKKDLRWGKNRGDTRGPSIARETQLAEISPAPTVVADAPSTAVEPRREHSWLPHAEQRRSQISQGHRLLRQVREKRLQLYTESEFLERIAYSDASYWMDSFLPALRMKVSENITLRVNATIGRARKNAALYDVKKVGVAEHIAEAFYDNRWYKVREDNFPRKLLRDQIQQTLDRGEPIELIFPVFSRKPFSPLKNRGPLPDLGELFSLARSTEATQIVNALSPTGCRLTLLADGLKYNRACLTPDRVVEAYQSSLGAWKRLLADDGVVRIVNYEQWVADNLYPDLLTARMPRYTHHIDQLTETFRRLFNPAAPDESLRAIAATNDVGHQLAFTFWSIATSVNYQGLFSLRPSDALVPNYYCDEIQRLYLYYIASLHKPLRDLALPTEFFPSIGRLGPSDFCELFSTLRMEAFEAAIRYVAISLADRDLNVLREIQPNAIKLTIHGKPGELHFLSSSHRDINITAQHSTGGITTGSDQLNFDLKYRIEREANNEVPVLVAALPAALRDRPEYEPLRRLHEARQPIAYVDNHAMITDHTLHLHLQRRNS